MSQSRPSLFGEKGTNEGILKKNSEAYQLLENWKGKKSNEKNHMRNASLQLGLPRNLTEARES